MRIPNSVQPPPPPHARINVKVDGTPETDDAEAGGVLLLSTLVAGIVSIMFGTMSLVLLFGPSAWTVFSMPLALLAIVLANLVLVAWWFLGGDIDIRIQVIGLTLGVAGILGWFARSGEIHKIIADVRMARLEKAQQPNRIADKKLQPEEQEKVDRKQAQEAKQEKPKRRVERKNASELTVDAFQRAAKVGSVWSPKQSFYDEFGKPSQVASIGRKTYLVYACKDGTAHVECPIGPFEDEDMICPVSISQSDVRPNDEVKPTKEPLAKQEDAASSAPVANSLMKPPADVQKERAKYLAGRLASWKFRRDDISVTQLFTKGKFKYEMRGAGYREFVDAIDRENWLAVFNKLAGTEHMELPPNREIDETLDSMKISKSNGKQTQFLVFVDKRGTDLKTIKARDDWKILIVSFPPSTRKGAGGITVSYSFQIADVFDDWDLHPDGIGWTRPWNPTWDNAIVAIGPPDVLEEKVLGIRKQLQSLLDSLVAKQKLGEIESAEIEKQFRDLYEQRQRELREFVLRGK